MRRLQYITEDKARYGISRGNIIERDGGILLDSNRKPYRYAGIVDRDEIDDIEKSIRIRGQDSRLEFYREYKRDDLDLKDMKFNSIKRFIDIRDKGGILRYLLHNLRPSGRTGEDYNTKGYAIFMICEESRKGRYSLPITGCIEEIV